MYKKEFPFWIITISVLIGITLPVLIKDGMFMDAMLYSSVSHNLSEGIGTFWFPQFSRLNMAGLTSFHEQPPLVFGIQAIFYKIFGDSMYTERIYVFVAMCITAWLITVLWKEACRNNDYKKMAWLPVLIWITTPDCYWSFSGNMMENTMGIFVLASGIFAFRALESERFNTVKYIISGAFVFLASFSKGVPGLFTISFPFIYWLVMRKISFKKMLAASLIMIAIPALIYGILLLFPVSRESLSIYFFKRLLGRINNQHSVTSRFTIIGHIFSQLIPQFILIAVVIIATGIKKVRVLLQSGNNALILFFVLAGFAGSLPMMLTLVQSGWYIVPTYPFFAIATGLFLATLVSKPISTINSESKGFRISTWISGLVLVAVLCISFLQIGKTGRDADTLHDIYVFEKTKAIPRYSLVSVPGTVWDDWSLQCYLIRYLNISVDPHELNQYYITDKRYNDAIPTGYKKLDIGLTKYDLYSKQGL